MLRVITTVVAAIFITLTIYDLPAEAKCSNGSRCISTTFKKIKAKHNSTKKVISPRKAKVTQVKGSKPHIATKSSRNATEHLTRSRKAEQRAKPRKLTRLAIETPRHRPLLAPGRPGSLASGEIMGLISEMAPRYGVPTWFALRIAKIESGYNPRARGNAGEIGVFQLKCATARGIGYEGGCNGLYDAGTNIRYGLKHLSLAIRKSGGNLRLAASKHNGGLGRKSLVPDYVSRVF
jgi:hypothetical protein